MGLFAWMGGQIESGTSEQITSISTNITVMLMPLVAAGLTIWIMAYAYAVIRGETQEPINRFLWDLAKKSLILYFALGTGLFQSTIIADVENVTLQLTSAINGGAGGGECTNASNNTPSIYAALDCSFNKFNGASAKISKTTYTLLFDDIPNDVIEKMKRIVDTITSLAVIVLLGWVMSIVAMIMYAIIFIEVVVVRMVLTVVFAFGPLFIAALAFEPTRKYFEGWASKVVYCVILQAIIILFVGVSFGVLSGILSEMVAELVNAPDFWTYAVTVPKTLISTIITMIVLAFVFTRLPGLAGELTGHSSQSSGALGMMALGVSYAMRRMPNNNDVKGGAMKGK